MSTQKGRVLAVDFGLKRIGLALSDPMQIIASPLENLEAGTSLEKSAEKLVSFLDELKGKGKAVTEIVIGLPRHMDGSESERSGQVRQFADVLKTKIELHIALLDERLTSVQADRSLQESGFSRKKRSEIVDRVSAVILLQTYLSQKTPNFERM
jgi:putative Holliday junction resolvase